MCVCVCMHTFCFIFFPIMVYYGSSDGKESACNVGDLGLISGLGGFPGGGHGNPLQYSCLENPPGQRSLEDYNSWGCKELDVSVYNYNSLFYCKSLCNLQLQ